MRTRSRMSPLVCARRYLVAALGSLAAACTDPADVTTPRTRAAASPHAIQQCTDTCTPAPTPSDAGRFGVVSWSTMGDDQTLANLTTETRAKWVRIPVDWSRFQPLDPNSLNPARVSQLHRAIDRAQAAGLSVMVTLQNTPPWARQCWATDTTDTWGHTVNYDPNSPWCTVDSKGPPHPTMWAWYRQWVSQMVAEYPTVNYWGIWNEPNDTQGSPTGSNPTDVNPNVGNFHPWPGTRAQDQYVLLVGYAADAIHAVAGKKLLAPETAGALHPAAPSVIESRAFLGEIVRRAGNSIDVVSVHSYAWPGATTTDSTAMFYELKQYADSLNGRWPMWLTEFGLPVPTFTEAQRVYYINQVVSNMRSNSIGAWQKSFLFVVAGADPFSIVPGYPGNTQPSASYTCFASLAGGYSSC